MQKIKERATKRKHADPPRPQFSPRPILTEKTLPQRFFLLTALGSNVNICSAYFQTSSGIKIKRGNGFHSSVTLGEPPSPFVTRPEPGCIFAVRPIIPFMGSGWVPSGSGAG